MGNIVLLHVVDVGQKSQLVVLVDHSHGSLEQACCEASHVHHRAIYEELLYHVLVAEAFTKPQRQSNLVKKGFSDDLDQVRDLHAN